MADWSIPFEGVDRETYQKFLAYHKANPDVWKVFETAAKRLINSGIKHYGAKAIMEYVRFHETIERKAEFDLDNRFTSYYARAFIRKHPEHSGFFEFRVTKGLRSARE